MILCYWKTFSVPKVMSFGRRYLGMFGCLLRGPAAMLFIGCNFYAYSWKLPAYNEAFLLTIDNFSFFAYNWSFSAYSFSFFAYNFSFFYLQLELFCLQWESASNKGLIRKILVSVKFVSAILGPEMAAPILWAPGKMRSFCRKTSMSIKFLILGGAGILGLGGGVPLFFL